MELLLDCWFCLVVTFGCFCYLFHFVSVQFVSLVVDIARYTSLVIDIARYTSLVVDSARYTSLVVDIARYTSLVVDIARYTSLVIDSARYVSLVVDSARYASLVVDSAHYVSLVVGPVTTLKVKDPKCRVQIILLQLSMTICKSQTTLLSICANVCYMFIQTTVRYVKNSFHAKQSCPVFLHSVT